MSFGIRLGLIVSALGVALVFAPFLLPRSAFGELGHGDGMGLIGMTFWGMLLVVGGIVITVIYAVAHARDTEAGDEDYAEDGEEIK